MATKVTVYGTATCPWCTKVKGYLDGKKVQFEYVDVGGDRARADEMMRKSGQMGVPVIEIDGKMIVGFDREAIDGALGL
ncbi:MAG: glutaredoxin domain-containing protein [Chlamydiota bacterium]